MNNSKQVIKSLVLTNLKITLHPHKGGARDDGSVRQSWRERWESSEEPSMFYSITGQAVVNDRLQRVTASVTAVRDGILRKLGIERPTVDENGEPILDENGEQVVDKMISEYPAPQSVKCHVENGELVLDEALPVSKGGAECPAEYGLSFMIFTDGRKAIALKDAVILESSVSERGTEYADVHALGGYEVVDAPSRGATGSAASTTYALPKGPITHRAARDTRTAAPATVDVAM
jgi:hypothetical protein